MILLVILSVLFKDVMCCVVELFVSSGNASVDAKKGCNY